MTPASGGAGTVVTMRGRGFGASDPVKVKTGFRILARTRTNRRGSFKAHFTIVERRRKPIRILTISGSRRVANFFRTAALPSEPEASEIAFGGQTRFRWSPAKGAPQSHVGLRGSRFRPRRRIQVTFGGTRLALGRTGRTGGFERRLTVPRLREGVYAVKVRIGRTRIGFSFEVTSDPLVAVAADIACDPQDPSFNGGLGTADACHMRQTANLITNAAPDLVLAAGDVQYNSATLAEFRASYDSTWGAFKDITRPVSGNHEYGTKDAADYFKYFGVVAGDPRKGYYSFDIGAWHVIGLNSNCSEPGINCAVGFAQEGWLRADLDAHRNRCTLAFWHHPMFSSGQHGNHPTVRPFFNALYERGADLVLVAHDHDYERFAPQTPDGALDTVNGIRQFVVGTGGRDLQSLRRQAKPNSELGQSDTYGVLMLKLHAASYDWQFVPEAGKTFRDSGTQTCH
jgi:calcineurin-like phosphoesterase family protein